MYTSLPKSYKGVYPFRIAATSFIYPDTYAANAAMLGNYVDEIELLMLEGADEGALVTDDELQELSGLSERLSCRYNIHLPYDVFVTDTNQSRQAAAIQILQQLTARCQRLCPTTYTLHLPFFGANHDKKSRSEWEQSALKGVARLLDNGTIKPRSISVETLDYPFEWLQEIIDTFDLSVCIDMGHLIKYGYDVARCYKRYAERTTIIHLHGVHDGKDHLPLDMLPEKTLLDVMHLLKSFKETLSLEVFSYEALKRSLRCLERFW